MSGERKADRAAPLITVAAAGLIAIVVGGVTHGALTQRWGPHSGLREAATTLDSFPDAFGPWRVHELRGMEDRVVEMLQCAGHVNRSYLNVDTSELVNVSVIVGPPGPTAVHTPDICYSSRDYSVKESPEKRTIDAGGDKHSFWAMRLRPNEPGGADLHVYYAWADEPVWRAADAPRYEYGARPYLYKVQVAGSPVLSNKAQSTDLCRRFLEDWLQSGWAPRAGSN